MALTASVILMLSGCGSWASYTPETSGTAPTAVLLEPNDFMKGFEALKVGDYATADLLIARHLQEYPTDPYALLAMGTVMENAGRNVDAMTYYRSAAKYGTVSPIGETLAVEDTSNGVARTVGDLALRNIGRLRMLQG